MKEDITLETSKTTLRNQISQLETFLLEKGYTPGGVKRFSGCWNGLVSYANAKKIDIFSDELCAEYLVEISKVSEASTAKSKLYIRGIKLLASFVHNQDVAAYMQRIPIAPSPYIEITTAYLDYMQSLGQTRATIKSKRSRVKKFLDYIYNIGIRSLKNASREDIVEFMSYLAAEHTSTGRGNILYSVKDFLLFCRAEGYIEVDLSVIIKGIYTNPNETLPSTYTQTEIALLLKSIDRATTIGKKHYAIIILAAQLGLRASDIISITIEDIKWEQGIIEFSQRKTGKTVQLPLIDSVKYALADYLSSGRPSTEHRQLFLRDRAPVAPYVASSIIYSIVSKQFAIAGLSSIGKNKGPHSLRHSLADGLLKEETSLPVIAAALGHHNTKNTSRYLRIDIDQLRQVALEVSI